ncbi:MAG: LPS export ABC transporter permease LptG [Piscirickettsiaceae bacterium]|nr:LPS export ABC transporter permease LptG [Piscirickettsiaceae bacterium]
MFILQRYIAKTILTSTILVLSVLLGLYTFMDVINELNDLDKEKYKIFNIISYISLSTPRRIYELLPIAALVGSILGLGNLASQSELLVIQAAGISIVQIIKKVMVVAIILIVIAILIGEVLRPLAEQKAYAIKLIAQKGIGSLKSNSSFWTRDSLSFNHIERILSGDKFWGISIYEFNINNRLRIITKAKTAEYEGDSWILSEVKQSIINEQGIIARSLEYARWKSQLNPKMVNIILVPPEFLSAWRLIGYIEFLSRNSQKVEQYRVAFWMKIMMPISAAVMIILSASFIFGPLRSSSIGGRMLVGVIVGICFNLFNQSFQSLGLVFGFVPWLTAVFPSLSFTGIAYYFIKRAR